MRSRSVSYPAPGRIFACDNRTFVALAKQERVGAAQEAAYGSSSLSSPGSPPPLDSLGGQASPKTPVKARGVRDVRGVGGDASSPVPGAASPPSQSVRKASTASSTFPARSFEFAPDRSPLQKLELELQHISREEIDAPQIGRSLSKKQEERLQRSTTISSRITGQGGSSLAARRHPKIDEDDSRHPDPSAEHRHRHRISEMLGRHHHSKGNGPAEKEDGYPQTLSHAKGESQTTYNSPSKHPATTSGHERVSHRGTRHHHHGFQFQYARRQSSSSAGSDAVRITQALGGEGVFDPQIVRLTLEDGELSDGAQRSGGEVNEDYDGMADSFCHDPISCLSSPGALFPDGSLALPMSSTRAPKLQVSSKESVAKRQAQGVGSSGAAIAAFGGNLLAPRTHDLATSSKGLHLGDSLDGTRLPPSAEHLPHTPHIPQTKEEKEHELILSYLEAVPRRPAPVPTSFSPPLNIKCGPLLRYTGLRRDGTSSENSTAKEERETWRGSIMIVTTDNMSDYSPPPVIRLFVQPEPKAEVGVTTKEAAAETTIVSATGEPPAVGSAEELPSGKGKPRDNGLLGNVEPARKLTDGEGLGKYKEVTATKLHAERGVTFWRFTLEIELGDQQTRIAYRINHGPSIAFWVPARRETMNIMFHSCNGFSLSVNPDDFCGPDPLWRDVLRAHQEKPFHVMLGGGDQGTIDPPVTCSFSPLSRISADTTRHRV